MPGAERSHGCVPVLGPCARQRVGSITRGRSREEREDDASDTLSGTGYRQMTTPMSPSDPERTDPERPDQERPDREESRPTKSRQTERLSARITGRVQGVGFRHFTTKRAQSLGCTGWVRNEADGSVRLEAEGSRSDLDALLTAVHDGPRSARVNDVSASFGSATGDFENFRVRR